MQILQWLFNIAAQEPPNIVSNSTSTTQRKRDEDKKTKQKNTVVSISENRGRRRQLKGVEKSKVNCENLVLFRFIQRKDVSRPFFYQTLNLKGLGSFRDSRKTRREEIDRAALGGNKVLPINVHDHSAQSSSRNIFKQLSDSNERDLKTKRHKKKAVLRVKELLKWAATAKNLNGKAAKNVDQEYCDESPKISISWKMESRPTTTTTTTTTTYTTSSKLRDDHIECGDDLCAGIGNWITTDSEFVVLEL